MRAIRSAMIALVVTLVAAAPSGAANVGAREAEFHQIQFQRTTSTGFLFVVMFKFEMRGAQYGPATGADTFVHEPFTEVYGCVAAGLKGVFDIACGRQKASAFKLSPDLSTVSIAFKARSRAYRVPITARLTTAIHGNTQPAPLYDVGVPIPPSNALLVGAGAERKGWGATSGKVTMSRFGSTRFNSASTVTHSIYATSAELQS